MNPTAPYRVTTPDGKVKLVVMNATDGLPAAFALMGTRARRKVAVRISGGCKGMNAGDKEQMLGFFSGAFRGFEGVAFSGGSRMVGADGKVDPMVTDIPGLIASENEGAIALGTLPRVELLTLQSDSRLVLDQWGNVPNPDQSGILIVQNGPDGEAGWDLDVPVYFRLMENWRDYAGFTHLGLIAWNGGAVTLQEIIGAAKRGWPVYLVQGSGRATDDVITALEQREGELYNSLPLQKKNPFHIVPKGDVAMLRGLLSTDGFLIAGDDQ